MLNDIITQSIQDEKESLLELQYLYTSFYDRFRKEIREIAKNKKEINENSWKFVEIQSKLIEDQFVSALKLVETTLRMTRISPTLILLEKIETIRNDLFLELRTIVHISSSLITSTDWQSPSGNHSLVSQAGRQTGKITVNINDYKRDIHLDQRAFELKYIKEYVASGIKLDKHAYLFNSGQAAFQTVLDYLVMAKKLDGKVIIGKNTYFQNKQLMMNTFGVRITEVDENNLTELTDVIKKIQPEIIYLDSLSVTQYIPIPNLPALMDYLNRMISKDTYLIIDNTCLSVSFSPFKYFKSFGKLHLIVVESLNKYAQFGLDRVTAGVVVTSVRDAGGICEYRKHAGTNITDTSVYSLPTPDRHFLTKRLARLERNTQILASELEMPGHKHRDRRIEKIIYPGLRSHNSFNYAANLTFKGSFLAILFKRKDKNIKIYRNFITSILAEAKKRNVNIVCGTSFGFNTTRIYLTASYTEFTESFIRISVGTENLHQIGRLIEVF